MQNVLLSKRACISKLIVLPIQLYTRVVDKIQKHVHQTVHSYNVQYRDFLFIFKSCPSTYTRGRQNKKTKEKLSYSLDNILVYILGPAHRKAEDNFTHREILPVEEVTRTANIFFSSYFYFFFNFFIVVILEQPVDLYARS